MVVVIAGEVAKRRIHALMREINRCTLSMLFANLQCWRKLKSFRPTPELVFFEGSIAGVWVLSVPVSKSSGRRKVNCVAVFQKCGFCLHSMQSKASA